MAEWWEEAFRADYLRVYPHRDDAEAAVDVADLKGRLPGFEPGKRVLDLACGAGRHLRAMAAAGIRGVGADISADLLAEARRAGTGMLVRCDMRRLPFRDGAFDAVTLFFNSFGYFETEAEDAAALREAARVLHAGGGLLLDLADPPEVSRRLVPRSERREGTSAIVEERSIVEHGRRVRKQVTIRDRGATRSWTEWLRLYSDEDLKRIAREAGLRILSVIRGPVRVAGETERNPRCLYALTKAAA